MHRIVSQIERDLSDADTQNVSKEIVLYVLSDKGKARDRTYHFQQFVSHLSKPYRKEVVLQAISYLVGSNANFLESAYEFIDDNGHSFEVEDQAIIAARETGLFEHPKTGRAVKDFRAKIYLTFRCKSQQCNR